MPTDDQNPPTTTKLEIPKELRDLINDAKASGDEQRGTLLKDNWKLRTKVRDLEAKAEKVPVEGSIVLTGDDAKAWTELQKIGPVKDLPAKLTLAEADATALNGYRMAESTGKAAEIAGFKPTLLGRFARADGIAFEFGSEKQDGKDVPTVSVKGADGKLVPLKTYAEANWRDDLPALTADSNISASSNPSGHRSPGTPPRMPQRPAPAPGSNSPEQEIDSLMRHPRYSSL